MILIKIFSSLIAKFKESFIARSILLITGGAVFAQVLSILMSPIITRIYTPEEYGVLTIFIAIFRNV